MDQNRNNNKNGHQIRLGLQIHSGNHYNRPPIIQKSAAARAPDGALPPTLRHRCAPRPHLRRCYESGGASARPARISDAAAVAPLCRSPVVVADAAHIEHKKNDTRRGGEMGYLGPSLPTAVSAVSWTVLRRTTSP